MKVTKSVRLNEDIWRRLKIAAVAEGLTIGDYIERLLKKAGEGVR